MKLKGSLIYWEVSELLSNKETLTKLGFDEYVPRNDYKTAMIKALKTVTKGDEKMYRRFNDEGPTVSFGVFETEVRPGDIEIKKELVITLDKASGFAQYKNSDGSSESPLQAAIKREYDASAHTINSDQFRAIVLRLLRREGHALAMRKGGGIYFLDARFTELADRLKDLFAVFPSNTRIEMVPVFDNPETASAIEHAASEDIFSQIDELIQDTEKKFADGSITRRSLEHRKEEAQAIIDKIRVHRENLAGSLASVETKIDKVTRALSEVTAKVEAGIFDADDFMRELESL